MSFIADLAIAAISAFDPVTGFLLGSFKATMDDGLPGMILNLASNALPGGFIKDIGIAAYLEMSANPSSAEHAAHLASANSGIAIRC